MERYRVLRSALALIACAAMGLTNLGCEGATGPMGPAGPAGNTGTEGPPGLPGDDAPVRVVAFGAVDGLTVPAAFYSQVPEEHTATVSKSIDGLYTVEITGDLGLSNAVPPTVLVNASASSGVLVHGYLAQALLMSWDANHVEFLVGVWRTQTNEFANMAFTYVVMSERDS